MVLREVWARLQRMISQPNYLRSAVTPAASSVPKRQIKSRLRSSKTNSSTKYHPQANATTFLDVARFGLLSIATLPFSLWVALYSYTYFNRVPICCDALSEEDSEISFARSKKSVEGQEERPCIGRDQQLAEVRALLSSTPHQILVVAGTNESGKSRFVSEILRNVSLTRGVTYIQLAQMVDSLSTLTHALVRAFDLRWLQMRHSLVDILPVAGSEILVMKERFSDRDLAQALLVVTEALAAKVSSNQKRLRPVIVIDGLGEGNGWIRSPEGRRSLERLIKWCIYVTKERRLAHIVLTGNEELVISLTDQNRTTRGHVKVIGLGDLSLKDACQVVVQEIPDATPAEVEKITEIFGGFIHDVQSASREIQARLKYAGGGDKIDATSREKIFEDVLSNRFRLQIERITAAFSKGKGQEEESAGIACKCKHSEEDDKDDMDPYLDPLKAVYSEAQARQEHDADDASDNASQGASWSQLQLWQTLQRLIESENMTVPFADLRDDVFDGNMVPLLELMNEDVLGFEVESSSESGWSWEVKPATPALGRVFHFLVTNSSLKERFQEIQLVSESRERVNDIEEERQHLRKEKQRLDLRKASLLRTVELGKELRVRKDKKAQQQQESIYNTIVAEEVANELRGIELRKQLRALSTTPKPEVATPATETKPNAAMKEVAAVATKKDTTSPSPATLPVDHQLSIQRQLKKAILQTYVQEGSKDKFERFRYAFEELAASRGGISAADVVKLIKATSGEDIDLKAAQDFIQAWDVNADKHLNYEEFVTMLLTDPKVVGATRRETKKHIDVKSSSDSSQQ